MIGNLEPYQSYTESTVPWVPLVPQHWRVQRAKVLFARVQRPVRVEDDVVTCFRDGVVTLRKLRRLTGFTEAIAEHGYQGIRKGDLVIHGMDAAAGAVGVSDSEGKGTPVYSVCIPRGSANPYYYGHLIREMGRSCWILALSRGIRERSTDFRFEVFASQFLPVPPPDEQAAIVRFLNFATRRIDRVIRAKRKLIGLLNEQRQAIIHQAVTRGLNPDAPLKDSGVSWLGKIPAHWEVRRLKALAGMKSGESITSQLIEPAGDYPVFGGNGVRGYSNRYTHEGEFVLIGRQGALCGNTHLVSGRIFASEHAVVASPKSGVHASWLEPTLRSMNLNQYSIAAAQPGLSVERVAALSAPCPPTNEQVHIAAHLDNATAGLRRSVGLAEREIALLREYRARLISDVVTGQVDVSGIEVPEEPEEVLPDPEEEFGEDEEPLEDADAE